jgi:hypothetical protein
MRLGHSGAALDTLGATEVALWGSNARRDPADQDPTEDPAPSRQER